jgi:hypothetical protein
MAAASSETNKTILQSEALYKVTYIQPAANRSNNQLLDDH